MTAPYTGGCQCGQIRYELRAEPLTLYACHCKECQKQSSSAFGMSMPVFRDAVVILQGQPKQWTRVSESGREVSCLFCGECGTRLFHNPARNPKITNVKPGTLDDTSQLKPAGNVWTQSAQKWIVFDEHTLNYEGQPRDFSQLYERFQAQQPCMMWNPEDYAKHSDAQLKWARELRQNLNLQGNESILDVGCGDGKITADFAATVLHGRAIGVDSSPQMIAYAARTYSAAQYPNLSFTCVDARCLDFEREFDLVFSNATLHWVDHHKAFLEGASRALRSGGRLVVSCGGTGNASDILQVFSEVIAREPWNRYFKDFSDPYFFYGDQDYAPWLEAVGLKVERLELVPKDMTHPGKEGLVAWIRTTWIPFTSRVPEHEQNNFIDCFVDRYLAKIPLDPDGLAHVRMVRLEVDALKP
jgi:trans-aconitate 2-methyltransferase